MNGLVPAPPERLNWKSKRVSATGAVKVKEYNPVAEPPGIVVVPNEAPPLLTTDTVSDLALLPGVTHMTTVRVVNPL